MSVRGTAMRINAALDFEVEDCINCGIIFAIPRELRARLTNNRQTFYCPNGHSMSYTEPEIERVRKQLEQAKRDAEWQRQRAESADKRLIAAKGQMTKLKNRVNHGVCPHCQRTVSQMERHIATKHPDVCK